MPASCMGKQLKIKMPNYTCTFTKLHSTHTHTHAHVLVCACVWKAQGAKYRDISKLS